MTNISIYIILLLAVIIGVTVIKKAVSCMVKLIVTAIIAIIAVAAYFLCT